MYVSIDDKRPVVAIADMPIGDFFLLQHGEAELGFVLEQNEHGTRVCFPARENLKVIDMGGLSLVVPVTVLSIYTAVKR